MSTIGKFAALSLLVVVGVLAIGTAFTASAVTHTVTNETIEQDVGNTSPVAVQEDVVSYGDNATVYNATGVELVEGTDYDWNTSTGEVAWQDTASTTDGANATISYAYDRPSQRSRGLANTLYYGGYAMVFLVLFGGAAKVTLDWIG